MMKTLNAFVVTMFLVVFVVDWAAPLLAAQQAEWCKKLPPPGLQQVGANPDGGPLV
jgi:hypothetical protein